MHLHKLTALSLICLVAVCIGATQQVRGELIDLEDVDPNEPVTLLDLLDGTYDGAVVGDKIFSDFVYSTLPNDDMPSPGDIGVLPFQDSNGHIGITLQGAFQDLPGNNKPSDALIRFTVEVDPNFVARGYRISDAHLFIEGVGVGDDSYIVVDESFQGVNQTMNVYATTLGGSLNQKTSDWVFFDELYTSLRVTKDILAFARNTDLPARVSAVDQSFSQVIIPEPTTFMIGSACAASILLTRRRSLLIQTEESKDP